MSKVNKQYKICTNCEIHHIENCDTCFGFGIKKDRYKGDIIPIIAYEAHGCTQLPLWIPCPECGSTPVGVANKSLQISG